ncbi:hypothetical protein SAMN04244548_01172 [Paracoccus pantotrophus]|nr:hypothetical protein SAMN04244548_01172 [Paracoccus pantotrophus]
MSDDLIERLRECAECKSSEAWGRIDGGQDLCIGAALATEAAAELSRLRAEVERLTKERDRLDMQCFRQGLAISVLRQERDVAEAALANERQRVDDLIEAHRARRQG